MPYLEGLDSIIEVVDAVTHLTLYGYSLSKLKLF